MSQTPEPASLAPQYPQPSQPGPVPPPYPQAQSVPPQYPQYQVRPPQYPQPTSASTPPPAYPQASSALPNPQPTQPPAPISPQAPPPTPPHTPPQYQQAPDNLDYQNAPGNRVHYKAHQRGADATALGQLALHLPGFLMSLIVVVLLATIVEAITSLPAWLLALAWLASGALVFHRPTEDYFARYLLKLRRPLPQEAARLEPVWRKVTARAGVEGRQYDLWIENSQDLNAYAAAGHIVGVTQFALERLPSAQLAAVLAHELGHHTGGHAWTSLLGYWYSLPGRIAWRVIRTIMVFTVTVASYISCLATAALIVVIGAVTIATITVLYGLPLVLLAIPYLMAAVGRRSELRADQHAASLGFAPDLAHVLHTMHAMEQQARFQAVAMAGKPPEEPGTLAKLLSTHPDFATRLDRLRPHLEPQR
ncbi:M48 family metalloprotease [Streptomyces sp. NPDC002785]|uniref:M48 family metalloprotease n=1 Tax=Streptomyces sp. NPDC002785 TaxID=3154543 RepID=UPI00332B86AA